MRNIRILYLSFIVFLFFVPIKVYAEEPIITETEERGCYEYIYGEQTFETNILDGETFEVGYFKWEDGLNISLLRDGKQVAYVSEDIIIVNGNYTAIIYDLVNNQFMSIQFEIDNSLNIKSDSSAENAMDLDNVSDWMEFSDEEKELFSEEQLSELKGMFVDSDSKEASLLTIHYDFDPETSTFLYSAAGKKIYIANVPNGIITNESVIIKPADNTFLFLYKDGELMFANSRNEYSEPGFYDVVSYVYNADDADIPEEENITDTNSYVTHFYFTIIEKQNNYLGVISAPEGFSFDKICFNQEQQLLPDKKDFFLEKDGYYEFDFVSDEDARLIYHLEFERDTVAPYLIFNQDLSDGRGYAPLSYEVNDKDATVKVVSGKNQIDLEPGEESSFSGWYYFTVNDKAGNTRNYSVYIKKRIIFFSKGMNILLITTAVVFIIYIMLVRHGDYDVKGKLENKEE